MKANPCRHCGLSKEYNGRYYPSYYEAECRNCENIAKHKKYLESKRKFTAGEPIKDIAELLNQEWVMYNGKTTNIEVIKSQQLRIVLQSIESKRIFKAQRKESEE